MTDLVDDYTTPDVAAHAGWSGGPDTSDAWKRALAHGHGLATIAGYLLKRTPKVGPGIYGRPTYLAAYHGDTTYTTVCDDVWRLRRTDPAASYTPITVYSCGCTSDDRTDGQALLARDYTTPEEGR